MNEIEDRLRSALHAQADGVDSDDLGGLERIRVKTVVARRRRRTVAAGVAVAAVVVAVVAAVGLLGDRDQSLGTVSPPDGATTTNPNVTTTTSTSGTTGTTATTPPTIPQAVGVWPPADQAIDDPVETARRFAADYVGVTDPVAELVGLSAGAVDISTRAGDGSLVLRSTVLLTSVDGKWFVTGAQSDSVVVDAPATDATIASPVTASGQGRGFEGNIVVEVREGDTQLGRQNTTASGGPDLAPFTVDVPFDTPAGAQGAVLAYNDSGLDGSPVDFTVVAVRFGSSTDTTSLEVYFSRGEQVEAVPRTVPKTQGVLRAALGLLLAGPTDAERADGLTSWFSDATSGLLTDVTIQNGTAIVDFDPALPATIPNASTSAGSAQLLAELDATVFQFPTVEAVEYRVGGSCEAFFNWLQGSCETRTRATADQPAGPPPARR